MQKRHFTHLEEYGSEEKSTLNPIHIARLSDRETETESDMLSSTLESSFPRTRESRKTETESDMLSNLLKSSAQGNQQAFGDLWGQYQNYLYSCCLRWMGGHDADAKDALNRAAFKAWEKLPQCVQNIVDLEAWLTKLTHNLCVDIHREHHQAAIRFESLENMTQLDDELVASDLYSPETLMSYDEIDSFLSHTIDTLPSKLREPFTRFYYQEMSYQDIAQQLFLSNDNARKRIQQARQILQKRLFEYYSGQNNATCLEEFRPEQSITSDLEAPIADEPIAESIDYKVTATCLEPLPYAWYQSPSPLGWI